MKAKTAMHVVATINDLRRRSESSFLGSAAPILKKVTFADG